MAKAWTPQPREVLQSWVDAILEEASEDLTDWETTFVSDMQIRLANKWPWTKAQEEKLEAIYADKTP